MVISPQRTAERLRGIVRVSGQDAASYLERMLSNSVEELALDASVDALLLTPKARVIALINVFREAPDRFLLLTEPDLTATVERELTRARFAAKVTISAEIRETTLVLGGAAPQGTIPVRDYGVPAFEVLDPSNDCRGERVGAEDLERLRILARTPMHGRDIDDRVLPAEAGLEARAISFTKGCYPGQEPVARLHYRGHPNRTLRVLRVVGDTQLRPDTPVEYQGSNVGRVTSSVRDGDDTLALAYIRREVGGESVVTVDGREGRQLH